MRFRRLFRLFRLLLRLLLVVIDRKSDEKKNHCFSARRGRDLLLRSKGFGTGFSVGKDDEKKDKKKELLPPLFSRAARLHHRRDKEEEGKENVYRGNKTFGGERTRVRQRDGTVSTRAAMDRRSGWTEVGKVHGEEVEKFEKENDSSSSSSGSSSNNDDGTDENIVVWIDRVSRLPRRPMDAVYDG